MLCKWLRTQCQSSESEHLCVNMSVRADPFVVASQSSYGGRSVHVWTRGKARLDVRLSQVLISYCCCFSACHQQTDDTQWVGSVRAEHRN